MGCLAERYGAELADELPEAQILSFDDYGDIGARLDDVLAGRRRPAHTARDRRTLLPITPADRQPAAAPPPPRPRPASATAGLASATQPTLDSVLSQRRPWSTRLHHGLGQAGACSGVGCPPGWWPR